MFESVVGSPCTVVVSGPTINTPPAPVLYLNGVQNSAVPTFVQISTNTNLWAVTFTLPSTGVYTLVAFSIVQFMINGVVKLSTAIIQNLEDEALGSWTWDKVAGLLTLLRQDGTTLATFNALDSLTNASKERLS